MPYHIGIDARFWRKETGGLSRYSQSLVRELLKLDTENRYTVIITPEDEAEFDIIAPNVSKLVVDAPYYSVAEQRHLPRILKEQNFDLVHFTHFSHPILYREPFVITVHDLIMHLFPSGKQASSLVRKMAYKLVMNDAHRAKTVIVPSESTKRDLVSMLKFPEAKIVATPEGSTDSFRVHTKAECAAVKKKFELPERYFLFVSRWEKYKGLDALIEAFEHITTIQPDVALVITGKPSKQRPEIAELIKEKQRNGVKIITPGFVEDTDLASLYSAATAYVHPSWYEGFGIMILEAFASGTPVITSNVSSLPEVTGDAGILINPYSIDEIKEALLRILNEDGLAEKLSEAGVSRAKEFGWDKMAAKTLEIYKAALAKS